jgi:hypothetical protein
MTLENKLFAVPSLVTSLNQNPIEETKVNNAIKNKYPPLENPCIANTPDVVNVNKAILVNNTDFRFILQIINQKVYLYSYPV